MATTTSSSEAIYSPFGRISRGTYWTRLAVIALGIGGAVWWGNGLLSGSILLVSLFLLPLQVMKRGRDAGWGGWVALLLLLPVVNSIVLLALGLVSTQAQPVVGGKSGDVESTPTERARDMDALIRQMK